MTFRFTPKVLFGATAMLSLGAVLVTAQDTSRTRPRSERRLPISKEAPGEVVVVRTDTVMIYRTDTVMRRIVDTVRVTRTRIDTVIPRLAPYKYPKGFYGGIAGGYSTPAGSIYIPVSTGGTAQVQLGWQNAKQVLGARIDWNGAWPGPDSRFNRFIGRPSLQNFSFDGKVNLPFNFGGETYTEKTATGAPMTYTRGAAMRFGVYGIGGFTYTTARRLPVRLTNINDIAVGDVVFVGDTVALITTTNRAGFITTPGAAFFVRGDDSWHGRGGWNAGGGLSMFYRRAELFVEARVLGFRPRDCCGDVVNTVGFIGDRHIGQARQVPVVLGLNWY